MAGPRVLAVATFVAVGAAAALGFVTIDPPPLKTKARGLRGVPTAAIELPPMEAPPNPTAQEFTRAPAQPAAGASNGPKEPEFDAAALRARADAKDIPAMEELGRRLIQGLGVTKDPQAGAGWLLRAAEAGSAQSAFNVGVMYERGFVVERDSAKAAQWYRKAADAGLATAKHNLALLLRDGKGVARDGKAAIELLEQAARQGMAASMFILGDIYERGDAAPRDPASALAWFAITGEFERQSGKGDDTALAKQASQRTATLQRTLTPDELKQAQDLAQSEFKRIVDALQPPKPPPPATSAAGPPVSEPVKEKTADETAPWPNALVEQVRATQQALLDLELLRDKPDGSLGPMTRNAIRAFQKKSGLRETGEPNKELYAALRQAVAQRDLVARSPLPTPPREMPAPPPAPDISKAEPPKSEPAKPDPPKPEPVKVETTRPPPRIVVPLAEAPPPPGAGDFARATPATTKNEPSKELAKEQAKADPPKPAAPAIDTAKPPMAKAETPPPPAPRIDLGNPPPPPPTTAELQRAAVKADPAAWPANSRLDQVKAIQRLLQELKFYNGTIDGQVANNTRNAIREYERLAGIAPTGEPTQALFESLKEMRKLMSR
jgi:peptidoglycan hydrolase-like protein with peptidoglycan-binding domain